MARRLQQRQPKILHGLDMSAIIEIPDHGNKAGDGNVHPALPPTNRLRRGTRQGLRGKAPTLYSAKYHPMDDVLRPSNAKRYHSEAFQRDEDTEFEAMSGLGSDEDADEDDDQPKPVTRGWSTGIRHSFRASSQNLVDYNMKRHPQDAELRLLDRVVVSTKRSTAPSSKRTFRRQESLKTKDENNAIEVDEQDDKMTADVPVSFIKRKAYRVTHSGGRRSVLIEDSDEDTEDTTLEDEDKESNLPARPATIIDSEAENDNIFSKANSAEDNNTSSKANNAGTASPFQDDEMVHKPEDQVSPPAFVSTIPFSEIDIAFHDELASSPAPPVHHLLSRDLGATLDACVASQGKTRQSVRSSPFGHPSEHPWRSLSTLVARTNPFAASIGNESSTTLVQTNSVGAQPRQSLPAAPIPTLNACTRLVIAPVGTDAPNSPASNFIFTAATVDTPVRPVENDATSSERSPGFSTFGMPSHILHPRLSANLPLFISEDEASQELEEPQEESEEFHDEDDDEEDVGKEEVRKGPRFPLSELDPRDVTYSRSRTPSARSSTSSMPYPEGLPTTSVTKSAKHKLPTIPAVANVFGIVRSDDPEYVLPANFLPHSSSFSAEQPRSISSPIATVPVNTIGLSRPSGAPPARRQAGTGSIFVRPDPWNIPSTNWNPRLDRELNAGTEYDQENIDPD